MLAQWAPYLHERCARRRNGSAPLCTNAHELLTHIDTPLFVRENLFDVAKACAPLR